MQYVVVLMDRVHRMIKGILKINYAKSQKNKINAERRVALYVWEWRMTRSTMKEDLWK